MKYILNGSEIAKPLGTYIRDYKGVADANTVVANLKVVKGEFVAEVELVNEAD